MNSGAVPSIRVLQISGGMDVSLGVGGKVKGIGCVLLLTSAFRFLSLSCIVQHLLNVALCRCAGRLVLRASLCPVLCK